MQGKIAVEEHFALPVPEMMGTAARYSTPYWADLFRRLVDVFDDRLIAMDSGGVEISVLSLNAVAVQGVPDVAEAIAYARRANDTLAEHVARRPDRFAAIAALPMQDPDEAARELARCVRELGFKGALVNGFSQVGSADTAVYYDLPQYLPFWAEVERLGVPFYLHPRDALPGQMGVLEGHPWLRGSPWGFALETATHALRLMTSGLFDRYPGVQLVLGHFGEFIPHAVWRMDHRLKQVPNIPAKRTMTEYLRSNVHVTTSGQFDSAALANAIAVMGVERIMFACDYPFESFEEAGTWFDAAPLSDADRKRIGRDNAVRLFGLGG
jgi:2,3-dihydroxybenzoate decarboxylase